MPIDHLGCLIGKLTAREPVGPLPKIEENVSLKYPQAIWHSICIDMAGLGIGCL